MKRLLILSAVALCALSSSLAFAGGAHFPSAADGSTKFGSGAPPLAESALVAAVQNPSATGEYSLETLLTLRKGKVEFTPTATKRFAVVDDVFGISAFDVELRGFLGTELTNGALSPGGTASIAVPIARDYALNFGGYGLWRSAGFQGGVYLSFSKRF